jgi:GNAT superfamily N-acetyltransferase
MTARDAGAVAALSGQLGYPSTPEQVEMHFGNGKLLGCVHASGRRFLESDPYAEIGGMVVDAGNRRRGVGRALLLEAEKWARERGYTTMRIRSNMKRTEARPFYGRMGYQVIKSQYVFEKTVGPRRQETASR